MSPKPAGPCRAKKGISYTYYGHEVVSLVMLQLSPLNF
jgi:hypothetical protein